eukprot:6485090-Karenia_brevis.AAC.1
MKATRQLDSNTGAVSHSLNSAASLASAMGFVDDEQLREGLAIHKRSNVACQSSFLDGAPVKSSAS